MFGFMSPLLESFGFDESQQLIAAICLVNFLSNFAGGLMSNILVAYSGPQRPRRRRERIGFRLTLMAEILMIVFALYYHGWLISSVTIPQIVYWFAAFLIAPLLAYIGSQITYLVFQKRIEANEAAYMKWVAQRRLKQTDARVGAQEAA